MQKPILALLVVVSFSPVFALAQSQSSSTKATDIPSEQVDAVLKNALPKEDQQIKVVDVGQYNLGVGIIHREPTRDPTDGTTSCIVHHHMTEVYIIRSGSGTLVTGGAIRNSRELADGGDINVKAVGPSAQGFVRNSEAQVRKVKPGDIVIIPADVCHGWFGITDHVDYLSVRPDTDRLLPAGYINPKLRK